MLLMNLFVRQRWRCRQRTGYRLVDTVGEKRWGQLREQHGDIYMTLCNTRATSGNLLCDTGSSTQCSVTTKRGEMGREMGGEFRRKGTCVYLWLIHVDVWQKPTQYCKAIILQFKTNKQTTGSLIYRKVPSFCFQLFSIMLLAIFFFFQNTGQDDFPKLNF